MRRIVGFKKLLEVQEKVKGVVDLVSPTRLLVKEGKVSKISARTGDHQERYMFLVSGSRVIQKKIFPQSQLFFNYFPIFTV